MEDRSRDRGEDRADVDARRMCFSCRHHDVFIDEWEDDDGEWEYDDGCLCRMKHDTEHDNGCDRDRWFDSPKKALVSCKYHEAQ